MLTRTFRLLLVSLLLHPAAQAAEDWQGLRERMVAEIKVHVKETADYLKKARLDERVIEVMSATPRHEFVPESIRYAAYQNRPLPIGYGQTISQPYMVAIMTDLLEPGPEAKVLEIGTGSGYQAAVLAQLVKQVYSIEIIEPLAEQGSERLRRLGHNNIETKHADGYYGWKEHAPFDGIMVTAAAGQVPPPLLEQLKPGGIMLIPVGGRFQVQQLILIRKNSDDSMTTRVVLPVQFVPLTGEH